MTTFDERNAERDAERLARMQKRLQNRSDPKQGRLIPEDPEIDIGV